MAGSACIRPFAVAIRPKKVARGGLALLRGGRPYQPRSELLLPGILLVCVKG